MSKIQTTTDDSDKGAKKNISACIEISPAFVELERGVYAALETYSGVNGGSGHKAMVSDHLLRQAREIVLEHLGLKKGKYVVIFCTPRRAEVLKAMIRPEKYHIVSSLDTGLPIGVRALAVRKNALPGGVPFRSGGTARFVSSKKVIWAGIPEKFEAGTPAIVNIIAFAKVLKLIKKFGNDAFRNAIPVKSTASEILYNDELENYCGRNLINELRKQTIGRNILVPTIYGDEYYINLDNAASTPTFTTVWDTVRKTWYQPEQIRQEIVQEVKSICAGYLDAPLATYDLVFTSNTTEAVNLAAENLSRGFKKETEPVILSTNLEHNSNDLPWRTLKGFSLLRLKVNSEGFINIHELNTILWAYNQDRLYGDKRIALIALSGASNVLGTFNNLEEISRIVHRHGARLFVDAAQMAAHRRIRMEQCGIDYLAFSAHRSYAPFGTGVLVARKGLLNFNPEEFKQIRSSGEENIIGIAALGKALVLLQRLGLDLIKEEEQELARKTLNSLSQIPGLRIYGIKEPGSPSFDHKGGVIAFSVKNIFSDVVARELAERGGIGVRYGYHSAHILIRKISGVTHFHEQLQKYMITLFPGIRLSGLVRVSLAITNTEDDIDTLMYLLGKIVRQRRYQNRKLVRHQIKDFIIQAGEKVYS